MYTLRKWSDSSTNQKVPKIYQQTTRKEKDHETNFPSESSEGTNPGNSWSETSNFPIYETINLFLSHPVCGALLQ